MPPVNREAFRLSRTLTRRSFPCCWSTQAQVRFRGRYCSVPGKRKFPRSPGSSRRTQLQCFDERRNLVYLRKNLRLFLFHVGFRFIQKKLIVFLHSQSTSIDQQDDQNRG